MHVAFSLVIARSNATKQSGRMTISNRHFPGVEDVVALGSHSQLRFLRDDKGWSAGNSVNSKQ